MSPIVLHGPRGIVSKDIGCGNNKILHPSVTIWTKPCARAFQNSTFPMHSNSICHKTTTFPLLKSASDEAITVTENGVIEIEDGMHSSVRAFLFICICLFVIIIITLSFQRPLLSNISRKPVINW